MTFKIPLLLFLLAFLLTQCEKDNFVHIPDDAFLHALIELGVDKNGDGEICSCEAEKITYLDLREVILSDMTGIEAFIHLDTLMCGSFPEGNLFSTLDVSHNTGLKMLMCFNI